MDAPIDGAENLPAFAERIAAFLVHAHRQKWERGIIFTHGGVIAVMQWLVEGGDLSEWVRGMPDPGEIVFLDLPNHTQPAAVEMLYSGLTSS
jgi:broad specificity phosphatase PhoE